MKKVLATVLAACMALSLVACGGGSSSAPAASSTPAASSSAPADEKVEVTMIAAQYGTKTSAWWADFVEKFNAAKGGANAFVDVIVAGFASEGMFSAEEAVETIAGTMGGADYLFLKQEAYDRLIEYYNK